MKTKNQRPLLNALSRLTKSDYILVSEDSEWDEEEIMEWARDNPSTSI